MPLLRDAYEDNVRRNSEYSTGDGVIFCLVVGGAEGVIVGDWVCGGGGLFGDEAV